MIGARLGSYTVLEELGRGGMGAVYIGIHEVLGRRAAIKVLLPEIAGNAEATARFVNEARAASAIRHPGIVEIYDVGASQGAVFIVMELLSGQNLGTLLRSNGPLPWPTALRMSRQIAAALAAAHHSQIVHRDLKPENVFLVPDSTMADGVRIKLLDFGIAKLTEAAPTIQTRIEAVMGTPWYMSPEQCRSSRSVDGRSDLYALGTILFEMLTGRVPFAHDNANEIMAAHMHVMPPALRSLAPSAPAALEDLVARLLAKSPDQRPPRAEAVVDSIDALLQPAAAASSSPAWTAPAPVAASAGPPSTGAYGAAATVPPRRGRRGMGAVTLISAMVAAAAVTAVVVVMRPDAEPVGWAARHARDQAEMAAAVLDGHDAYRRGDWAAARAAYSTALDFADNDAIRALRTRAGAAVHDEKVVKDLEAALDRGLDEYRVNMLYGSIVDSSPFKARARQAVDRYRSAVVARAQQAPAISASPAIRAATVKPAGDVKTLIASAENAAREQQYELAFRLCEEALASDPTSVRATTACAIAACNLGLVAKARVHIKALEGQPSRHAAMRQICRRLKVAID